eukprot:6405251-Pyramimonas_sp.AAC.1
MLGVTGHRCGGKVRGRVCGWVWKPCLFRVAARSASHGVYSFLTQAHRTLMQTPVGELVVGDLVGAA